MNDKASSSALAPTVPKPALYRRTSNTLDADLGENKLAIMGLAKNRYYTINPVGRAVWAFLAVPHTRDEIRDHILTTYHVAPDVCEKDVATFLQELLSEGLVESVSENAAACS